MAYKSNPILAAFEAQLTAKLEAQHTARLGINEEINLITHMISCNEDLKVGPGRSERVLNGFLESKLDVVKAILEDDDPELIYTKYDIARRLKQIFGPDNWKKYQHMFPLLKEFWDEN